ncbi:MAG TPA: transferrin receptor-like dimerization domain-containing protein, partial [Chitinophagaceae bacterium]|nr:transferrin receptor-like dimerization domain-containing protein [Chitinophagaceae bacterium]
VSIKDRKYAGTLVNGDKAGRSKLIGNKYIKLSALGAGSDWGGFLQHLGIASMNLGFGGEGSGGEYHSIFDSYDAFVKFKDPGYLYGVALSKTAGRIMLRLANAEVLPIDFNSFFKTVNDYAGEVKALLENTRAETETENKMIKENLFDLAKDPTKPYAAPKPKDIVPFLNFSSLENALAQLKTSTEEFQKLYTKAPMLPAAKLLQLNEVLYKAERSLLQSQGLPRRIWYRHQVYAPGFYTGYGVKTLPGIREAIEQRYWKEAQDNIEIVAKTLQAYTAAVTAAVNLVK